MAAAQQEQELPDLVLYEILVRLPPEDFHRCRCLSTFWAARLSSSDAIDHHLRLRGKIRLSYDDIMTSLVLDCCDDSDYVDDHDEDDDIHGDAGAEEEEEGLADWRSEYRRKGYVEVEEDHYEGRGEMSEEMAKLGWSDIIPAADSGIHTVQYGALHPRIREPLLMAQHHDDDDIVVVVKFGEKTEEEVDREMVAFLRRCRRMDPPALLLQQLHTFQYCTPPHHQQQQEVGFEDDDDHQDDYSSYSGDDDDEEDADGLFKSNPCGHI